MSAFEIVGSMLAGLGLFFMGISTLTRNLRQLTGRRFRMLLERWTRIPLLSALGGALLGATMQTGSAITFILVGMVGAGMITVERSLPVRLGAAVGTSTMVFVATLDIQVFILFLLGVGGIALTQSRTPRPLFGVLFGGGLLFFGLRMVGSGASTLTELAWFRDAVTGVNGSPVAAFVLGSILSILVQSPQSVAILSIALTESEVLTTWTTVAIIYGSNFGGGLSTYFLSAGFRGTSRQIMVFQVLFNVLTGLVLFALFFVERWTDVPLVHAAVTSTGGGVANQMAFVYLTFNVFGAIMMYTLRAPILGWIEKRWPPSPEEDQAKLEFLHDLAIDTPDLAIELAAKEQTRFLSLLSSHLDALRLPSGPDVEKGETTTRTLNRLDEAIGEALSDLSDKSLDVESSEKLLSLANRQQMLGTLQSSLSDFAASVRAAKASPRLRDLAGSVIEALDAVLMISVDALASGDRDDLQIAFKATQDRSQKMRDIRRRFMQDGEALSDDERLDLVGLTNGLERTVWVLHEMVGEANRASRD
jgi:phosphate:Na+ symporter